jgi:hypothetical protein
MDGYCCVQGSICFEWIKTLPTTLVALIFGAIAAGITYHQYAVTKAKLKLDLFDKRYAIFQRTVTLLDVARKGTRERNYGLAPFNDFRPQAAFLFGKPIERYLIEASTKWNELHGLEGELDGAGIDRQANIASSRVLKNWFEEQVLNGAKAQFGAYLDFESWK